MKKVSIKSDYYQAELIIKEERAILSIGNIFYSDADISEIEPNGYTPRGLSSLQHKPMILDWNPIKILAAVLTIKYDLFWGKQDKFNIKRSSYGLKHRVESRLYYQEATEILGEKYTHLANGELIVAMLLLGFQMKKKPKSINCFFNLQY
jgi:hypothetical protein